MTQRAKYFLAVIVLTFIIIDTSADAWAIRHACKGCSRARKAYIDDINERLCRAYRRNFQEDLTRLERALLEIESLERQYAERMCPDGTRQCNLLAGRIERKKRSFNRAAAPLLLKFNQILDDCNRSRRSEQRNGCSELEAGKYCDAVDAAVTGTVIDKIRAAFQAVDARCTDIKQERDNWRQNCGPTPTPIPITPTPEPTVATPTSTPEVPATTPTAVPTASPITPPG